jgi:hypothetical protein
MALKNGSRSLPSVGSFSQLQQYMGTWKHNLTRVLQRPIGPRVPPNFRITNARGGFRLEWAFTEGADGYEIQRSDDGSFSSNVVTIPVRHRDQTSYFDPMGGAAVERYYRVRATAGTENAPHSVGGPFSTSVSHTSIDASDTVTVPSTNYDNGTSDQSSVGAGGSGITGGSHDACVEEGTEVVYPDGAVCKWEILPNEDWVAVKTVNSKEPVNMHPDTMVAVFKKASELQPGDRIELLKDGAPWEELESAVPFKRAGKKVRRTVAPDGVYGAGDRKIRLHNAKAPREY